MATLQVLMPMGGLGSRFADAGYTTPKPLIDVEGKAMFLRALDSFKAIDDIDYIFVIRKDHDEKYGLKQSILDLLPAAKISILDHDTGGAVETCLIAEPDIDDATPLIIADCDIYFESSRYFDIVKQNAVDGLLLTFNSDDPRYSYVEVDDAGKVVRTAEKVVISNNALLGGYYFRSGELFKSVAHEFVDNGLPEGLKEFYASHLFNILLARGGNVAIAPIDVMHIFGTPEELNKYLSREK
jgi:NDP-sugar pyrophosphorylase family protein